MNDSQVLKHILDNNGCLSCKDGKWEYWDQDGMSPPGTGHNPSDAIESYIGKEISSPDSTMYMVGYEDHKMTHGPTPSLGDMLSTLGKAGQFIYGCKEKNEPVQLFEWMVSGWVAINGPDWASRLHQEECPSVQINGSPKSCTCNRRGRYIKGRRGPRQPGIYDG